MTIKVKRREMEMFYQAELVLDLQASLGEGPQWDSRNEILYWVDILGKKLHAFDPETGENRTYQFDQYIGAVVLGKPGRFLLAMKNGIYQYDSQLNELTFITNPEADLPNNRFNDGKCDPAGRFWAGTMDLNGKMGQGSLYRLDANNKMTRMLSNVSISNGLAWSPDRKYMYFIDTPTKQIVAFDYDDPSGDISNKRLAVQIPDDMGNPDGMTIDSDGMIWVAHWGGARVTRWNPQTGELLGQVKVPAKNVTSCTFGGKNLDELYITTAQNGLSEAELAEYPGSGELFKVKTNVKGMVSHRFE